MRKVVITKIWSFIAMEKLHIVSKEEVARLEQSMQKIFADIITEVSSIACWVYVEKYVHHKSLQEMLAERKDVDKFIFAVDTLFEKFLETEEQQS